MKYNNEYVVRPFGLQNTGVICYFNSMLQCFLSCTSVIETFSKNTDLQQRNSLCAEVWKLIKATRNTDTDISRFSCTIWTELIKRLKQTKKFSGTFGLGQEDSHEGFLIFLDALDSTEIEQLFEHRYRHIINCGKCGHKQKIPGDESVFIEFSREEINNYGGDIENMIISQTPEIDNDYKCSKCSQKGDKKKTSRLSMTPEVLIVLLKKYHGKWSVDAPMELNIPNSGSDPFKYKLVALSEHAGTTTSGHYWTNAVRDGGKIWNLNDMNIGPGSLKSTITTYMLWYHAF